MVAELGDEPPVALPGGDVQERAPVSGDLLGRTRSPMVINHDNFRVRCRRVAASSRQEAGDLLGVTLERRHVEPGAHEGVLTIFAVTGCWSSRVCIHGGNGSWLAISRLSVEDGHEFWFWGFIFMEEMDHDSQGKESVRGILSVQTTIHLTCIPLNGVYRWYSRGWHCQR